MFLKYNKVNALNWTMLNENNNVDNIAAFLLKYSFTVMYIENPSKSSNKITAAVKIKVLGRIMFKNFINKVNIGVNVDLVHSSVNGFSMAYLQIPASYPKGIEFVK